MQMVARDSALPARRGDPDHLNAFRVLSRELGPSAATSGWSQAYLRSGRIVPRIKGGCSEAGKRGSGDQLALEIEGVVDGGVQREEPLRGST